MVLSHTTKFGNSELGTGGTGQGMGVKGSKHFFLEPFSSKEQLY